MTKKIKAIGVLTSGGDSPGMNCTIRAVVRTGIGQGLKVFGIKQGFSGLINDDMKEMTLASVGNILQRGGTILGTSRSEEFRSTEGRKKAFENLKKRGIDSLIIIGGDGSFKGAMALNSEHDIDIIGIPGTIDNDISGTFYTIGYDTAVQTAIDAVDKIRDTAASHNRIFLVEVMGRNSDAIALNVGVCTGAENIVFPNKGINYEEIVKSIKRGKARGKDSSIIIVAEDDTPGLAYRISEKLKENYKIDSHVCILGHIQRGGSPTATDRFMGSRMGYLAVHALLEGRAPCVTISIDGRVTTTNFSNCLDKRSQVADKYFELIKSLSI